jgi:carboxymethylenebutenolidase
MHGRWASWASPWAPPSRSRPRRAIRRSGPVVLCYGTGRRLDWSSSEASFLGHYAQDDPFEAVDDVRALADGVRAAGRPFELHVYPGTGHWFMEPDRHAFVPDAAALAWERTIDFLRRTLAGVA